MNIFNLVNTGLIRSKTASFFLKYFTHHYYANCLTIFKLVCIRHFC